MHYSWLIVGAGLYGAVFAREIKEKGKTCAVIDRRGHIAGNIYTEKKIEIDNNLLDKIESDENPPVEENNPDKRAITPIIKNLFGSAKGYLIASEKISEKFIIFTSFI